ncbi:phage tail sheath subtilisin-like domain-containing protein [Fundidesulfovibrio putealis]|uniref:phage tail sheath subtilisin-like domain-containing protein n=1 Tax=Fundidesulfovibrio putealis TaxID=270496 RepID=UPI00040F858C|nr:phage tail sheath subtilisin-like domain-containing protein [Fundidesulfovibrio putealis]
MPANFLHGVETIEIDSGPRPIRLVKTAVIGLVGVAPIYQLADADRTVDKPTLILNDKAAAQYGGAVTPGFTIPQAMDAIFDQQLSGRGSGAVIMVNVFDPARHKTSVAAANKTFDADGLVELGHAGVAAVVVKSQDGATTHIAGTDYTLAPATGVITRVGTGAIAAGATVQVSYDYADPSKVTPADIIGEVDPVTGKRTGMQALRDCFGLFGFKPKILIAPGFGALASVVAELDVMANALRAFAYVDAPIGTTFQQAIEGRGPSGAIAFNTSSKRLMLCYPHVKVYDESQPDSTRLQPYSAILAGMRAAVDMEKGYWWSSSNQEIKGVIGMERLLTADIADPNSEVNLLNESGITTIYNAWGTGLRTWGNRSAAWPTLTHPRNFECVQRTADVIAESIEYFALQMIDAPITNAWIDAVTESVNAFIRTRMAEGAVIDGRCWYDKGHNEATELAAGHVTFDYDFMPPTPAERITFRQIVNIEYLKSLGNKTWAREEA